MRFFASKTSIFLALFHLRKRGTSIVVSMCKIHLCEIFSQSVRAQNNVVSVMQRDSEHVGHPDLESILTRYDPYIGRDICPTNANCDP